jgi:hypothetical protein
VFTVHSRSGQRGVNLVLFLAIPVIGRFFSWASGGIRLTAFFLIPIMLITWRMGRAPGYAATACALSILLLVELVTPDHGTARWILAADVIDRFVAFFVIVAVHGRMPSVLTGANLAIRDLIYLGVSGDGDSASIGLGQFVHSMRRAVNMVYIVINNGVCGAFGFS